MPTIHNPQRRRFLKALGVGTAAAGVAQVPLAQAETGPPAPPPHGDAPHQYRETEHVRAYYATLRD